MSQVNDASVLPQSSTAADDTFPTDAELEPATLQALVNEYGADIEPDLLREAGQPPAKRKASGSPQIDATAEDFQDSSLLWATEYAAGPSDQTQSQHLADAVVQPEPEVVAPVTENGQPPSKKKRTKPRQSHAGEPDLPEGELEYMHPSQDPKLGPVFVHPGPNAAQACVRCHRIKRKCDTGKPRCAGCTKADVPCVFELTPATSAFVLYLKADTLGLSSQIAQANERIHHLESIIAAYERGDRPTAAHPSTFDAPADLSVLAQTILSVGSLPSASDTAVNTEALPPYDDARRAVDNFFACYDPIYPFLDKNEIQQDLVQTWTAQGTEQHDEGKKRSFIVFLVVALGLVREDRATAWKLAKRTTGYLAVAVTDESLMSVKALLLLAMWATFESAGLSLWQTVGQAMRVCTAIGLHQTPHAQVNGGPSTSNSASSVRLFWSVYNLERLVATTLCRPFALEAAAITVESPPTVVGQTNANMFAYTVAYRRLVGRIQTAFYNTSTVQSDAQQAVLSDLQTKLQAWLSSSSSATQDTPMYKPLLELQYNLALCSLYRPSRVIPVPSAESLSKLGESAKASIRLFSELSRQGSVPANALNASQVALACSSFVYSMFTGQNVEDSSQSLAQIDELSEAFIAGLGEGSTYRSVYEQLRGMLTSGSTDRSAAEQLMLRLWQEGGGTAFDGLKVKSILQSGTASLGPLLV